MTGFGCFAPSKGIPGGGVWANAAVGTAMIAIKAASRNILNIIIVPEGMMLERISRRKFTQVISTAGAMGTALLETMYAEMQEAGSVSRDSVRTFLDLSGTRVGADQIVSVQASLERALESLKRIRDRDVAQHIG